MNNRIVFFFVLVMTFLVYSCKEKEQLKLVIDSQSYMVSMEDPELKNLLKDFNNSRPVGGRETPIFYREDSAYVVDGENISKYSIPIETDVPRASDNLVIEKDKNGVLKAFIYSLRPDIEWFDANYKGNKTDFLGLEGSLLVTDLISGKVQEYTNRKTNNHAGRVTQECDFTITTVEDYGIWYIWIDLESCTSGGGINTGGGSTPGGDPEPDPDDWPGSDGGTPSSGGGSSGPTPVGGDSDSMDQIPCPIGWERNDSGVCVEPCPPGYIRNSSNVCVLNDELNKISKCDALDGDSKDKLKRVITNYLGDCRNLIVYNYIISKDLKFCFKIDENSTAPGGYNPFNGDIIFNSNEAIDPSSFGEEFFHAYQDAFYGGLPQSLGRSNMEFEAKLYHDLTNDGECCINFFGDTQKEYFQWLFKISNGFTKIPSWTEMSQRYYYFVERFTDEKTDYDFPIDYQLKPLALLRTSKCN